MPSVAVVFPSGDLVHAQFTSCLANLAFNAPAGVSLNFVNPRSSLVPVGRNLGVDVAVQLKATHVLFLDSDITFPTHLLTRLLSHKKHVVGCFYRRRVYPFGLLGEEVPDTNRDGLVECTYLPTGALLFRTDVLEKLKKPYFRLEVNGDSLWGEDILFCKDLRAAGYKIYGDKPLSLELAHLGTHPVPTDLK